VLVAETGEGLLLVDGGNAQGSAALLKLLGNTRPVRVLFNTHWHPDQTGSNEALAKAGAKIIAHENTKLWLGTEINVKWQDRVYPPRPASALPTETIYSQAKLDFGGTKLEYGHLPQAHTDGDLYVHFKDANVLVAGDVVCNDGWPVIDWRTGGWIGGMVDGLTKLVAVSDTSTRIVPGRGPLLSRADLETQRNHYAAIFERLEALMRQGKGPDEALAANPTKDFEGARGDPTQFVTLAFQSMWGHFAPNA